MNDWKGIGHVTRDIKCSYTNTTRKAFARFTLAIDRIGKNAGADFIPCLIWDKQAELMAKSVKQGELIAVDGRIQSGSYQNNNGDTVYTLEVVVNRFEYLIPKKVKEALENEHAHQNRVNSTASTGEHEQENSEHEPVVPDGFEAVDEEVPF